jgi:hypothetical protein
MENNEKSLVKLIARLSPWLAPLPSGYFVARASISHLDLPLIIGISIGIIIEFLGISSVHTWLWLADWNSNKRKSDPEAPTEVAVFLGAIYLCATVGLTVVLEVVPALSTYSPILFPALAIVGAINLVLISQQEHRELVVKNERLVRQAQRMNRTTKQQHTGVNAHNRLMSTLTEGYSLDTVIPVKDRTKSDLLDMLVDTLLDNPNVSISELARQIGRSRQTTYKYLEELHNSGRIPKNGNQPSIQDLDE